MIQSGNHSAKLAKVALIALVFTLSLGSQAEAGQGCPFDNGSCMEYCNQQGCNMGYCGHFAWIQCICRKCGDEWNWYDKVRYIPDKTVNQTELDSLKLNGTAPLILTNSSTQQPAGSNVTKSDGQQKATLTTLLIPDLSDTNKLADLNDIPDENSEKFLDYLAKNHEKLVQVTSARAGGSASPSTATSQQSEESEEAQSGDDEPEEEQAAQTGPLAGNQSEEETIEIQISSSNNNSTNNGQPQQKAAPSSATPSPAATSPEEPKLARVSALKRLLKVSVFGPEPVEMH